MPQSSQLHHQSVGLRYLRITLTLMRNPYIISTDMVFQQLSLRENCSEKRDMNSHVRMTNLYAIVSVHQLYGEYWVTLP